MALDVLFCKNLMVNAENSPVRTFTPFPNHATFTPRYGQLVLGNTLTDDPMEKGDKTENGNMLSL